MAAEIKHETGSNIYLRDKKTNNNRALLFTDYGLILHGIVQWSQRVTVIMITLTVELEPSQIKVSREAQSHNY